MKSRIARSLSLLPTDILHITRPKRTGKGSRQGRLVHSRARRSLQNWRQARPLRLLRSSSPPEAESAAAVVPRACNPSAAPAAPTHLPCTLHDEHPRFPAPVHSCCRRTRKHACSGSLSPSAPAAPSRPAARPAAHGCSTPQGGGGCACSATTQAHLQRRHQHQHAHRKQYRPPCITWKSVSAASTQPINDLPHWACPTPATVRCARGAMRSI